MGKPSNPSALSRPSRPAAMAIPAASPMAEAMTPTATASAITEPSTWRLLAPSARSRPFSRVRCATVIENVLKIMNAPTSSAMIAKIIMNVLKKPIACWNESCISLVTVAPVTASIPCGSAVLEVGGELLLRDARLGHEQDAGRPSRARRPGAARPAW